MWSVAKQAGWSLTGRKGHDCLQKLVSRAGSIPLVLEEDGGSTTMDNRPARLIMLVSWLCLTALMLPSSVTGQEDAPQPESPKTFEELRERLQKLEQEIERLKRDKTSAIPADKKQQRIVALIESPYLARTDNRSRGRVEAVRYFVAKLSLVNLTPKPVTVKREGIQLIADGETKSVSDIPESINYQAIQVEGQVFRLKDIKTPQQLTLEPGGIASTWVFFDGLDDGTHVPELKLKLKNGDDVVEVDVNASQKAALGLQVERIGPRGCLGLLTVNGALNTINVGSLMDELDQLAEQKVVRVVLCWAEGAPAPETQLAGWFRQNAQMLNREQVGNQRFPQVPSAIREFHLCKLPQDGSTRRSSRYAPKTAGQRIHDDEAEAVHAALATAFQSLPRDELLQSIETGNLFARAAALSSGGGRLAEDKLPVVLSLADDNEPLLQQAALTALKHFGDQSAIDKLVHYAKKNTEPLASTAIESLAGSRFAVAHEALKSILENEPPASQKRIVKVLAAHPRPIWSEVIYRFVNDPREGLNQEALQALTLVGHPQLVQVLRDALSGKDDDLRQKAFVILTERTDHESEEIAVDYTLGHLTDDSVDDKIFEAMLKLLNRVKDKRAVPLLLERFSKLENKRAAIITLSLIGDREVAEFFEKQFDELQTNEKSEALKALHTLHSPKFRELATRSLLSDNSSLVQAAARGLQEDGSPEAIQVLAEALEKGGNSTTWTTACNALASLATPEARKAIIRARDEGNRQKREVAQNALRQIYRMSPGIQYVYRAGQEAENNKFDKAAELYTTAIKLDPLLPLAFSGRANLYLKQGKYKEAGPDFEKCLELDPWDSQALTGLCVVMVVNDAKIEEAIEKVEKARKRFEKDALFAYNAACVYARSVEQLKKNEQAEGRDEKIKTYTEKAMSDLKLSIKRGFNQLDWMREDPDLNVLHDLEEFQKISLMKK